MAKTNAAEDQTDDTQGASFEDNSEQTYTFNMQETAEDTGFEPMPKGMYLCTIDSVEFKLSKSSGAPMWAIKWVVAEGEFAEKNRFVFDNISFKDNMIGRAKTFLVRIAPELAALPDFSPKKVAEDGLLIGKQAKLKLDISSPTAEYPNPRNEVKDRFAPGAGGTTSGGDGSFTM